MFKLCKNYFDVGTDFIQKILVQKDIDTIKCFCPKSFVKIRSVTAEKVSAKKIVVSKKIWVNQNFGPKN